MHKIIANCVLFMQKWLKFGAFYVLLSNNITKLILIFSVLGTVYQTRKMYELKGQELSPF